MVVQGSHCWSEIDDTQVVVKESLFEMNDNKVRKPWDVLDGEGGSNNSAQNWVLLYHLLEPKLVDLHPAIAVLK